MKLVLENKKQKEKIIISNWENNAVLAESIFGTYVDWDERFYICPECGEPVYDNDWTEEELSSIFCPICGYLD